MYNMHMSMSMFIYKGPSNAAISVHELHGATRTRKTELVYGSDAARVVGATLAAFLSERVEDSFALFVAVVAEHLHLRRDANTILASPPCRQAAPLSQQLD